LADALKQFGDKLAVESSSGRTASFEVTVGGQLVHSKLTMGHGKCNTPAEMRNVLQAVEMALA